MFKRGTVVFAVVAGLLLSSGCVLRGPSGVKDQLERSGGRTYHREFGMTLGRTGLGITRWALRIGGDDQDQDDAARLLRGVNKVQVGVYEVVDDGDGTGSAVQASDFEPYDPIVQIREDGEAVMVLALTSDEEIRKLLVVVDSDDALVIVRLRGNLDRIIEDAIRFGLEEGDREDLVDPVVEQYRSRNSRTVPVVL